MDAGEKAFWDSNPHPATHAAASKFFREKRDRERMKQEIKQEILRELRAQSES